MLGIILDTSLDTLFWVNASKQLRHSHLTARQRTTLRIPITSVLTPTTLPTLVSEMRGYIDGSRGIAEALEDLCGIQVHPSDFVAYSPNECEEPMIFVQRRGQPHGLLLHSDLDWVPMEITMDDLVFPGSDAGVHPSVIDAPLIKDVVLDRAEAFWIASCLLTSQGIRQVTVIP